MAITDTETVEETLVFTRQIAGAEDLIFGFGSISQIREGENTTISLINSNTIPYDNTRSVKDALDELFANAAIIAASSN